MEVKLKHRGRAVTDSDVAFIRRLIAEHPESSRRALSKLLCEAWGWVQPIGLLRDLVCRGLMLELHRAGLIELPAVRHRPPNNIVEAFFGGLIEEHHYLGYTRPVGEHLKYLVYATQRPIACMAWCSAPRHLGPRDRFIGWSPEVRRRNIRFIAYNTRFLIFPWVEVRHLASHLLGGMAKVLVRDWERTYGHPVHFLETFIDPQRFRGTCYRAANWISLGRTTGRGKDDQTGRPNRPIKEILGYPLSKRFRELLSAEP